MATPLDRLLTSALALPEATEDHPWSEHAVAKVRGRIFAFFGDETITLKLPDSGEGALGVAGAHPARYGLGRHGWVVVPAAGDVPVEVLEDWLEESYRAVAPKRLATLLDSDG